MRDLCSSTYQVTGIFVDSRKENTQNLLYDTTSITCWKRVIIENQITMTEESKGRYLTYYTPKEKTKNTKPATKQCALGLFEWMKNRGMDQSLEMIGSNTTNDVFGWSGMLQHVEQLLNRRLFRSFCCLHINDCLSVTLLLSLMDQHLRKKFEWSNW